MIKLVDAFATRDKLKLFLLKSFFTIHKAV